MEHEKKSSNRKRDIVYTTLGDIAANVTITSLSLLIPTTFPSLETQRLLNEATAKTFTLSFESWATDRKAVCTVKELQLDIGSSSNIIAPLFWLAADSQNLTN